ncbi:MAG: 6-methylsalicylate decarboxylase, partial [Solirubrobacteraceae bacterium]|nr:6-methylsalicylate decarboxylase [Solirubrobacteraceae bacterium]
MPGIDVHQHLWPEPLQRALAARTEPPCLVRRTEGWVLRLAGEPESAFDPGAHDPAARAGLVEEDGLGRALIAPSVPLGIESLAAVEAEPLLAAYHDGVLALGEPFGAWAAVGLAAPDLPGGAFAGACVPAAALAGPGALDRLGPVLEALERRDAALLVHPGPAGAPEGAPAWWPALNGYVAQMQAAWHGFGLWGRPAHPRLRVCFAMLAGLAPLQRERLVARGGRPAPDPLAFLETSSYGARAVDAILREVGVDQLVHGSDRPVIAAAELPFGDAVAAALRERNPARLLG